jgi:rhodanese-related sulfurtransferase
MATIPETRTVSARASVVVLCAVARQSQAAIGSTEEAQVIAVASVKLDGRNRIISRGISK